MAKVKSTDVLPAIESGGKNENLLIKALRANDKTGAFDSNASVISYKTGFPVLDYYLGYKVNVFNENDEITNTYSSIGITAGSFVTFIGKPSTSKTTTAVQIASNIVRPFPNGSVIHYDLEQAQNYSRIQALNRFSMHDMENGKYVLRQENNSIDEIYEAIMQIYFEKTQHPDVYRYDTGLLNEFGKPIMMFEPTVIIIDSIAALSAYVNENNKEDVKKIAELEGNTYANRIARDISQFYNKLLPRIRAANIIVIAINQIKTKVDIGVVKSAASIMYLAQDETLPGGWAPQFYAHILLKFVAQGSEKFNSDDDGFDGFGVRCDIIKSRTNQAGKSCSLIYDKIRGIDSLRTSLRYAKDVELMTGNKNSSYFITDKDTKFSIKDAHLSFDSNIGLYKTLYGVIIPQLETRLSSIHDSEISGMNPEEMAY